tara:strand:- start:532 stop:912 length:381 start_codon:yes stop_codon:yes gene_type:complete
MKIDHINIAAPMALLISVRDFYRDALGLEEGPRPNFAFKGFWMYAEGKPIIHLMESDAHFPTEKPHYLDHVAFQMTGVNAYVARLQSLSIGYKTKYIADFKISQVFCHDPCGNGVEVNFANEVFES